jgi:hypothetical protein
MSFALSGCVTEVVRQMIQLTSAGASDSVRPVSGQYATILPEVTPTAVLRELRGSYGMSFIPSVGDWSEVGQGGEGMGTLYKLTRKPPNTSVYYLTIRDGKVWRVTRAT